jgi:spore coat polysaccharide biosynthesis protein SpsF
MNEAIIILQARMGSSRLPAKVLHLLQGLPLLSHCIRRLRKISPAVPVIVATSRMERDNPVVELAKSENIHVYRGSESDVLDRYYSAAGQYSARSIIRATGDNPFIDVVEGRRLLCEIQTGKWDYVSMVEMAEGKKLPVGTGLEAFTFEALRESWQQGYLPHHREHVNEYILENLQSFNVRFIPCPTEKNCPDLRLTIDTQKDIEFIKKMLEDISRSALELSTEEIIAWWKCESSYSVQN